MSFAIKTDDLPENWLKKPLGECATVQTGIAKGRRVDPDEAVFVPYLRVANVQDGYLDLSEIRTIELRRSEVDRYLLQPGDVVLTEGGDLDKLGRGYVWSGEIPECVHQNHVFAVRVEQSELDPNFFSYQAQSSYGKGYFLSVAHKTTNLACINTTKLKAFPVLIPPLHEQKAISQILATVQRAIAAQERIIQSTTELKKALMQKLFTEGLRGEPQKETEIGLVPESWGVVRVKEHCIESAFGPRFGSDLYSQDGNILTLRTTDMDDDGRINYDTAPHARIEYQRFAAHYLQVGDVVVSRSGTCGIASVFEGHPLPVLPGAFLIRLRMKESVQPMFLRHYINSPVGRPYILQLAQGAIQKNISGTRLGSLLIPLPSREEQEEISARVGALDYKLMIHHKKLATNRALFRTLLQELMTARSRTHGLTFSSACKHQ